MKKLCVLIPILCMLGCGGPDPIEEVRKQRRNIKLTVDLTVSLESHDVTYIINAQNMNSEASLAELTTIFEILNENDEVIWQKQHELDLTGLGHMATKEFTFKENVGEEVVSKLGDSYGGRAYPAPDVEGDEWKSYSEFMRVITN